METMGLEAGIYLYHKMTPPPNLGHSWVIFEGWSQLLPATKLFRPEFEQSCSAMATQKLEEKVQQYDAVVESSKTGCRSQSRARSSKTFIPEGFQSMCMWGARTLPLGVVGYGFDPYGGLRVLSVGGGVQTGPEEEAKRP